MRVEVNVVDDSLAPGGMGEYHIAESKALHRTSQNIARDGRRQLERYQFACARQIAFPARNPGHHAIKGELGDPKHGVDSKCETQSEMPAWRPN
jgi:hypothetical protein